MPDTAAASPFSLLPSPWASFAARLAESITVLDTDEYLILSHPRTHHFVQCTMDEGELRLEAKSNHFVPPARQLGMEQELRLVELGWKAPTHAPDAKERVRNGSPNWFRDYAEPVDADEAALMMVMTLREVYGVRSPRALRYHAFRANGCEVRFPTLGVAHDGSKEAPSVLRPEWLEELQRMVTAAIALHLPWMGIRRLPNGDLLAEHDGVALLVREVQDPFDILFYGVIMPEAEETPRLLAAVNRLNQTLREGRAYYHDERVAMDWSISANVFTADEFIRALQYMFVLVVRSRGLLAEAMVENA
ncbi:MAG TPA: hypothetical protein VMK53_06780 [Gemmatimonadales bacterium]|nr:hypothetical protein [Gemmatimonadales bacterium]